MKLEMKLTERDKKLLAILAVVLVVAGLGGYVALPLMNKASELATELTEAQTEQTERQIKVNGVVNLQTARVAVAEEQEASAQPYINMCTSQEIDRMLTETALAGGVGVVGLSISMPQSEETSLWAYDSTGWSVATDSSAIVTWAGMHTVNVTMRMSGDRMNLQAVLDSLLHNEPGIHVTAFQWDRSRDSEQSLSVTLEIYMLENAQEYLQRQAMESQTAEAAEEEESGETE